MAKKAIFSIFMALALTASSVSCIGPEVGLKTKVLTKPIPSFKLDPKEAEALIATQVNLTRAQQGLSWLATEPVLVDIARERCDDMLARGYFSHYDPETGEALVMELLDQRGYVDPLVGENLADCRTGGLIPAQLTNILVQQLLDSWMKSPGHRENILDARYTKIGVGVAVSPEGNRIIAAQVFLGE